MIWLEKIKKIFLREHCSAVVPSAITLILIEGQKPSIKYMVRGGRDVRDKYLDNKKNIAHLAGSKKEK